MTDDYLEARRTGIGGSDIGAILGMSYFKTAFDVFLEKTDPAFSQNVNSEAVHWGTVLEDVVAKEYHKRTGRRVQRVNQMLRHPEHDFAIANIDRAVITPSISKNVRWKDGRLTSNRILECKTANARMSHLWGDEATNNVPDSYLLQCQWYLGITDCDAADLAVLIGGQDYRIYTIARDAELFADMLDIAEKFWNNCKKGVAPDPVNMADALKKWPQHIAGKSVVVDVDIAESCARLAAISNEMENLKAEEEYLKTKVMAAFGEAEEITYCGDRLATWKTQKARRLDGKRLKEERPDIAAEYTHEAEIRVFRLKK